MNFIASGQVAYERDALQPLLFTLKEWLFLFGVPVRPVVEIVIRGNGHHAINAHARFLRLIAGYDGYVEVSIALPNRRLVLIQVISTCR
ncbi:hypothetical protein WI73_05405 [Burkholderia ubonensis]|nr:hypothetical protein WI73_05405 [Burkholderia ubonensis]